MNKRGNRVVKIIDHFKRGGFVYIVMEYCKDGSLQEYVRNNGAMGVLLGFYFS